MTFTPLTYCEARQICEAALAHAAKHDLKPLGIAILDHSGEVKLVMRQDNSPPHRARVAQGKAYASWALGMPTRDLEAAAKDRPHFFTGVNLTGEKGFVPTAGGVPIKRTSGGEVIGAIGISGDTSDRDEECAIHAINAGLQP